MVVNLLRCHPTFTNINSSSLVFRSESADLVSSMPRRGSLLGGHVRRTAIYNGQDRLSAYIHGHSVPHLDAHRVHGIVCNKLWFSRVDHFASRAYKLAVMERIEPRPVMRCWKCKGPLSSETAINMQTGVSIQQFVCLNCGRRWHAGDKPRPLIAA